MTRFRRAATFVLLVACVAGRSEAQLADVKDPCHIAVFAGLPASGVWATGSWSNSAHVEEAALDLRKAIMSMRAEVQKLQAASASTPLTSAERARLETIYGCLPWLRRRRDVIDDQLERLGINSLQVPGERAAIARAKLLADLEKAMAEAEAAMKKLRGR